MGVVTLRFRMTQGSDSDSRQPRRRQHLGLSNSLIWVVCLWFQLTTKTVSSGLPHSLGSLTFLWVWTILVAKKSLVALPPANVCAHKAPFPRGKSSFYKGPKAQTYGIIGRVTGVGPLVPMEKTLLSWWNATALIAVSSFLHLSIGLREQAAPRGARDGGVGLLALGAAGAVRTPDDLTTRPKDLRGWRYAR